MEKGFFQTAEKLNNEHRRTRRWHKVITVMAAIVVFCTTYALILPAITWEHRLLCDTKEHTHTASCYAEVVVTSEQRELTCSIAEHVHGDSCYEEVTTCVCGLEEDETHQHTADCMVTERVLTCEQSEHTHDDSCFQIIPAVTQRELICNKPEHVHTDACYDAPPSSDSGYYCGYAEHKHNDSCYFEDGSLRCTMKEHTHTLKCKINDSADVETAADWESTFADVKLTGNRGKDVLAIAETQIGYTESSKNFVIDDEKTGEVRGYSRYGDWFGNPYGDWCAMFCAFCLDYAGVDNMPVDANCQTWIEKLTKEGLYHEAGSYDPKPGDLVFYCWDKPEEDKDRCGDHVGFVCEVVDAVAATETTEAVPAMLKTIEGNWSDSVCQLDRELNSDDIIGYAELPKAFTVTYDGDDFTVTAKYDADAKIPADAKLLAEKIPEGSELYQQYYRQSVEAMLANSPATSANELAISYLQFYDIGFYVNGEEIEPEGPVDIVITNNDTIEIQSDEKASAIHFGSEGTEILNVDTETPETDDAASTFSFTQESFSVTGVVVSGTNYNAVTSVSNGDQVIVATWRDGTTYYLTSTNNNNGLLLTTDVNNAKVWTVEYVDGIPRLKNGTNSYVTVQDNQAGLGNIYRGNLGYVADGNYWEIYCNNPDVYLNQHGGPTSTRAAGYGASGANDAGSKWVLLKQNGSAPISGAPAVGSVTGVQTDNPVVGEWYIIYGGDHGRALNANNINSAESLSTYPTNGGTVTYNGNADVVWQWTGDGFRNRNGDYLRVGANDPNNWLANYWLDDSASDSQYNVVYNPTHRILYQQQNAWGIKYNKVYIHGWENVVQAVTETSLGPVQQSAEPIYLAQVTGNPQGPHDNHPRTSTTGTPDMRDLVFYNFDATTDSVKGLAGVEYTLYDSNGNEVARYMTTKDFVVPIGRLDPGTYTIKQTSVPEGYVVVSQDRQFTVSTAGTAMIGAFYDYKSNDYAPDKTASVVDYDKRTYQVDLKVKQSLYDYVINNSNFSLVVDQSNSMLFPSELTSTGKQVTFYRNPNGYDARNGNALNNLGLDKNQVYYFIADEATTSTVYALFWDGSGWVYQDASYYAKAQNRVDGYEHNIMDGTNVPKFASSGSAYATGANADSKDNGVIVHGGDINYSLDSIYDFKHKVNKVDTYFDWNTYTIYTGSQYNRLHDLQQATAMLCNTLSSMTSNATIRLETFDKFVETCQSYNLGVDGAGVTQVIAAVNGIECAGGTRQDYAFRHLIRTYYDTNYPSDVNKTGEQLRDHLNTGKNEYVILITDGAPNGGTMDNVVTAANELKNHNNKTTIVTAGLSLQNVLGGSDMLKNAATDYSWSYAADTAGALSDYMTQMLFRIAQKQNHNYKTTVTDEISDSFYPINPANNQALADGTIINLQGQVLNDRPYNGQYGTVRYNSQTDTWYVEWNGQTLNYGNTWTGRIYLKAKEDFIGGNSVDTNKSANISLLQGNKTVASTDLETPTVNVKLLNFNQVSSEETVFLGDKVSIPEKIQALYDQLKFTKLVDNGDNVHNKSDASSTSGLENKTFTPAYAWAKDLTEDDWNKLFNGETLTFPYTYDDDSSHGPVGYFTVQLTKTGDGSGLDEHATTHTGNGVETYTLQIVYTPYKIGEGDGKSVRKPNVHNGTDGPGREVTEPETSTNIHKVNVVDGKVTVIKELTGKLKSDAAQTYTFKLLRQEGDKFVDTGEPFTVTVPANATEGNIVVPNLPRGTYRVEEQIGDNAEFYMKEMSIVPGTGNTNCYQEDSVDTDCTFTIGEDADGNDLIEYVSSDGYHKVYSYLRDGYTGINGVSYEALKVINDKVTYTADIPVVKNWDSAIGDDYRGLDVYVALYQNGQPVLDESGNVWALRLNGSNNWNDTFTVPLQSKNEDVSTLGYTVRELSGVTSAESAKLTPAIVMNAATAEQSIVYYADACTEGVVKIGDSVFGASTEAGMVPDGHGHSVYTLTVYNTKAYALPETGGSGFIIPYICGALLVAGALIYGYSMRRKSERRKRQ